MSKLCDQVIATVRDTFPGMKVKTEHFAKFKNQKLFVDIWIPQLNIAIEVHGRQHDEFVDFFHGNSDNFRASKRRDSLKEEWAAENGYIYLVLREKDLPITAEKLLEKIYDAGNI